MKGNFSDREKELIANAEAFVTSLYQDMDGQLQYHNLAHTMEVVEAAGRIASSCKITGEDHVNLILGAWFHDTGYHRSFENHEQESVRIMRDTLSKWNVPESQISKIAEVILSTQIPHNPTNLLGKIICDADMIHLADTKDYADYAERLRIELNNTCAKNINRKEWRQMNIEFLSSHCYFTEYGKKFLRPKKFAILKRIKSKVQYLAGI